MKRSAFLGLVLLAGAGGEAAAQCAPGTQVQNTGTFETATVTFNGSSGGNGGTITIAGVQGDYNGNRSGTDQAAAFDNTPAGSQPAASPGYTFTGTYTGWSAGPASGATVVYTATTVGNVPNIPVSVSGQAVAPTVVTVDGTGGTNALLTLLNNSMVCGIRISGGNPSDTWQEHHGSGGALTDYKLGPGHPRDPSKPVGSWSVSGTGTGTVVTHTYTPGGTFSWTVHDNRVPSGVGNGPYAFCNGGVEVVRANIFPGAGLSQCLTYP